MHYCKDNGQKTIHRHSFGYAMHTYGALSALEKRASTKVTTIPTTK
jgi:hypothetical protein